MKQILLIFELTIAFLLIIAVIIQPKGTGLDSSFGGSGEFYRSKRGVEKIVTIATIALSIAFGLVSILLLVVP